MKLIERNICISFFLIVVFLLNVQVAFSQQDSLGDCRQKDNINNLKGKPWRGNNAFLKEYLNKIGYFDDKDKVRYLVPIKFWVYRNDDGSGGATYADVDKFMNDLNYYNKLNKTGFQFYINDIEFINKSKRTIQGYYFEAPMMTCLHHTKNVINVHILDGFKIKKTVKKLIRGSYNYLSRAVLIRKLNSSTSLSHEIGHYFGLLHPHRNYNKGKSKQEPVSRTRCSKNGKVPLCQLRGDYLSDTPAEPKLSFLVNNDCEFVGSSLKDDWGDNYKPNINNIMSYPSNYYCRNNFTEGQVAIMLFGAKKNRYHKFWSTDYEENQKYFFDKSEPNDHLKMASPIEINKLQKFNFHKIFVRKRKDKTDYCDWYKFEVKDSDKKNLRVIIKPDENNVTAIKAELFDKNKLPLSEGLETYHNPIELKYNYVVSDWYYIKIKTYPKGKFIPKNDKIDTYSVEIFLK